MPGKLLGIVQKVTVSGHMVTSVYLLVDDNSCLYGMDIAQSRKCLHISECTKAHYILRIHYK